MKRGNFEVVPGLSAWNVAAWWRNSRWVLDEARLAEMLQDGELVDQAAREIMSRGLSCCATPGYDGRGYDA